MTSAFYLSAAHKSSGKTTLSVGICAAMRQQGTSIQPFKKGPDFIDPIWLAAAAGNPCYNLDFYTMHREEISELFLSRSDGSLVSLVEGNKGLFDGMALDGSDSNAGMASFLGLPVVLVLDTRGMTRGIAPLLLGYQDFAKECKIGGVILNRVAGPRHEGKLRSVLEEYTDLPLLGCVPNDPSLQVEERHLGLIPGNEHADLERQISRLAEVAAQSVNLNQLQHLGRALPERQDSPAPEIRSPNLRIGYLRDRAFGFYYADDLETFRRLGAELIPVNALEDPDLPEIDGLFLGGGFPEMAMEELEANVSLRSQIRDFIDRGGPAYAECGGLMYLTRSIQWNDQKARMVGAIEADTVMHERPQGRGYVRLEQTGEAPWGEIADMDRELPAHEFHHSALFNLRDGYRFAYRMKRGHGITGDHDGLVHKNLLASYSHMRSVGDNRWIRGFVDLIRQLKDNMAEHPDTPPNLGS